MSRHNVAGLLREGRKLLDCGLDAQVLLGCCLQKDRAWLFAHPELEVDEAAACRYCFMLAERGRGKPVQYIVNNCEFMSLDFYVDESVLIPRPDTETLAEKAIALIKTNKKKPGGRILELCTGSGCIAVALAYYCKNVEITAVDISPQALKIAEKNAIRHSVQNRITWIESDLFFALMPENGYDMILSNPPYIPKAELPELMASVRDYEPMLALDGGSDGLAFYRRIAKKSREFLTPSGLLLLEIGYNQGFAVRSIMEAYGYRNVEIIKDIAGHDRVVYTC